MRVAAFLFAAAFAGSASAACPPDGMTRAQLSELRGAKWVVPDTTRDALALGLLDCLAHPDPALRDEIGFEALQSWMRAGQLGPATLATIRTTLLARLKGQDAIGFSQPFAALVLAEVARTDRIKPWLSSAERSAFVREASTWLAGVRDYRGYIEADGWRHGVAHGADLMLQLALNPALAKAEHETMLAAIAVQVLPAGPYFPHFYQFGEGERLMAPVFHLARRDTLSAAQWEAWFASLAAATKQQGPVSMTALAQRHNLKAFLQPLYVSLAESGDAAQRARLLPIVTKTLKQVD
jgi:hypothetical protein